MNTEKTKIHYFGRLFFLLALLVMCLGCSVTASAKVTISKTSAAVTKDKTLQLKLKGTTKKVTWSSGNKSIATVSSTGLVTAVKKGTVTITAKVKGSSKAYTCKITVQNPVSISKTSATLFVGKTLQLKMNNTTKTVTWSTSNKSVAAVSTSGKVTAKKKGTATITAKVKGSSKAFTCKITVKPVVSDEGFTGENNAEKIFRYLLTQGFTRQSAAAVVGNLMYESGGGPNDVKLNAVELATGRGVGMCQWTDTDDAKRRTNFVKYCKAQGVGWPNTSLRVQVDFLMKELKGDYGTVWYFLPKMGYDPAYEMTFEQFKKCTGIKKSTAVFCANFERPYFRDSGLSVRTTFAQSILAKYK